MLILSQTFLNLTNTPVKSCFIFCRAKLFGKYLWLFPLGEVTPIEFHFYLKWN
jgi:hypothetical protein